MNTDPPKEPTPFERFDALVRHVVSVPRKEVLRREQEWKKQRSFKKKAK
jgi:hypothetical protein